MRGDLPILKNPVNHDNPIVFLDIAIGKENGIEKRVAWFYSIEHAIKL